VVIGWIALFRRWLQIIQGLIMTALISTTSNSTSRFPGEVGHARVPYWQGNRRFHGCGWSDL